MTEQEAIAMHIKQHEAMMGDIMARAEFSAGMEKRDKIRIVLNAIEVLAFVVIAAAMMGA